MEKKICVLPPIRVSESLELELHRLATLDDRKFAEYVRLILERHCWGHARSVSAPHDDGKNKQG